MTFDTIIAEVQAIDTTNVDAVNAAVEQIVADLNTLKAEQNPSTGAPAVSSVVVSFTDGTSQTVTATA